MPPTATVGWLALDPSDEQAKAGLAAIADRYVVLAEKAFASEAFFCRCAGTHQNRIADSAAQRGSVKAARHHC